MLYKCPRKGPGHMAQYIWKLFFGVRTPFRFLGVLCLPQSSVPFLTMCPWYSPLPPDTRVWKSVPWMQIHSFSVDTMCELKFPEEEKRKRNVFVAGEERGKLTAPREKSFTNDKDSTTPNEMTELQDYGELRCCRQETNYLGLFLVSLKATYTSHLCLT